MNDLRSIPSVDYLLQSEQGVGFIASFGRPLTLNAIRVTLDEIRRRYAKNHIIPTDEKLLELVGKQLQEWTLPTLRPVINAAGVILHTNLGRAPLSKAAMQATQGVAMGYSTLEYDLGKGKRGSRLVHAEALLRQITGAEAAIVVNNNSAAVMLVLTALARRRSVVIARSQLVEIGGGFRVPDVMKQSGAKLLEVGTTNRVHLADYEEAVQNSPALFMRAHRSNFQIVGFTSEPSLHEIAEVAHRNGVSLVDDLGSGSLLDTSRFDLAHEPMVQESLDAGADLVCFSGDKLLGGPQAGIVVGRADLIAKLKKHPLARAIRADKLCLAALTATLMHYLKDEAEVEIPIWRMIATELDEIQERADAWRHSLGQGKMILGKSTIGGGSLPGETLPTYLLALTVPSSHRFLVRLRQAEIPIIARAQDDMVVFDPRTVLPEQDEVLLKEIKEVLV